MNGVKRSDSTRQHHTGFLEKGAGLFVYMRWRVCVEHVGLVAWFRLQGRVPHIRHGVYTQLILVLAFQSKLTLLLIQTEFLI